MDVKILNIWDIQDEYKDVLICNQAEVDLLAKNISEIGLIQPVVIAPDNRLICGRKRLAALKIIGARRDASKYRINPTGMIMASSEKGRKGRACPPATNG